MAIQLPRPRGARASGLCRETTILPVTRRAVGAARRHARGVLAGWALPATLVDEALLVVSELVTNAVTHGAGPAGAPVTLTLEVVRCRAAADMLMITVRDWTPVSLALHLALSGRQVPAADWSASGRGLVIVRGLADWVAMRDEPDGKSVCALILLFGPERLAA